MKAALEWLTALGVSLGLGACDLTWVKTQMDAKFGTRLNTPGATTPSPVASSAPQLLGENARRSKANAEILQEIFKVVFIEAPHDAGLFGTLLDSINQGASFEGIHNGLINGDQYRKLESADRGASPRALKVFSEEMARFALELPKTPTFDATSFAEVEGQGVTSLEYGNSASPRPRQFEILRAQYAQVFVGAGIFRLKRVLSEVAIQVVAQNREYPQKMALWYSKWAVRMCSYGLDFGLPQRSQSVESFHFDWAVRAGEDRVKWEVLNRLHRLLNAANPEQQ